MGVHSHIGLLHFLQQILLQKESAWSHMRQVGIVTRVSTLSTITHSLLTHNVMCISVENLEAHYANVYCMADNKKHLEESL